MQGLFAIDDLRCFRRPHAASYLAKKSLMSAPLDFLAHEPEPLRQALFEAVTRIKAYKDCFGRFPFDIGCPACGDEPVEHLLFSKADPSMPNLPQSTDPLGDAIHPFTPWRTPRWAVDIAMQAFAYVGLEVSESTIHGTLFHF